MRYGLTRLAVPFAAWLLSVAPAGALETDQYWSWGREMRDSAEVINARVNRGIARTLERMPSDASCDAVAAAVADDFRRFLFQRITLWAAQSPLVDRVPADFDEMQQFRRSYLYHRTHFFDVGTKVPPMPTIQVDGVRFGADKLSHFFSEGWLYYRSYRRSIRRGLDPADAERAAMRHGLRWERTILGLMASGVLSLGDLEANHRGLRFYRSLCETPRLRLDDAGWRLDPPFDLARHVSPEWDESYVAPIYSRGRWRKVRPVLLGYCDRRELPDVLARHAAYRERDRRTPTERLVDDAVASGRLPDPASFTLQANCPPTGGRLPEATTAR